MEYIYIYIYNLYIKPYMYSMCPSAWVATKPLWWWQGGHIVFMITYNLYIIYIYIYIYHTYLRDIHKVKLIFTFLKIIHKNSVETFAIVSKVPFTNNLLQLISIKFGKRYLIILIVSLALRFSLRKSIQLFSHYRVT